MTTTPLQADSAETGGPRSAPRRVALVGNPNTGKTTLFNTLTGLRHRTSNFPGTTQDARLGRVDVPIAGGDGSRPALLIDLPGVYSLMLDISESRVAREALAGQIAPAGERAARPAAMIVVADATNLSRNLSLVGEALALGIPAVVALTMVDRARAMGLSIRVEALAEALGCPVVLCDPRDPSSAAGVSAAVAAARPASASVPGGRAELELWASRLASSVLQAAPAARADGRRGPARRDGGARDPVAFHASHHPRTDRLDSVLMHPAGGPLVFAAVMAGLFWAVFSAATIPMDLIDSAFAWLTEAARSALPAGAVADLVCDGIIAGVGATVIFLPQICLLVFLIALLEDTGYLARAAFVADRLLRPFGLRGHAFVPLLSSHACALPGIMACRAIPDPKERLAAILVAPFMTCSARLPVYVLLISVLFPGRPLAAALAFVGCYALGIAAAMASVLLARRTILKGQSRPMVMELPAYKWPSLGTALVTTWDRGLVFLRKAGTVILAICVVLWWLQAYPHSGPDPQAERIREQMAVVEVSDPQVAGERLAEADAIDARRQQERSFAGRIGRAVEPAFAPLGFDWRLCIGVVSSFAAREVFVSTMAVVVSGADDPEAEGVMDELATATRDDGVTPIFTPAASVSLLVFYVLAMQCLPTLAVTAREAGSAKWALLQLGWMSAVAYAAAFVAYRAALWAGM
jgi:ferrous iron transport protein B